MQAVSLTDLAARLKRLTESLADLPAVDRERVEVFRKAVAGGTYKLDTRAVAEKLAAFEKLLPRMERSG